MTVESGHFRVLSTDVQLCHGGYLVEAGREKPRPKRVIGEFDGWPCCGASGTTRRCIARRPGGPESRRGPCCVTGFPRRQRQLLMALPML